MNSTVGVQCNVNVNLYSASSQKNASNVWLCRIPGSAGQ